jgi:ribonucleotide reductase alpha subunit
VILITLWWLQKLGKKLAVSKQAAEKSDLERCNLRKLNALEVMKNDQIKISNRFAVLENLSDSEHINRYWKNINENIQISVKSSLGLYELKQHKS